jgi:hypothetical protein
VTAVEDEVVLVRDDGVEDAVLGDVGLERVVLRAVSGGSSSP